MLGNVVPKFRIIRSAASETRFRELAILLFLNTFSTSKLHNNSQLMKRLASLVGRCALLVFSAAHYWYWALRAVGGAKQSIIRPRAGSAAAHRVFCVKFSLSRAIYNRCYPLEKPSQNFPSLHHWIA